MDRVQDRSGVTERTAFSAGGCSRADPTGVNEPGVGFVFLDLVGEHLGVAHWVQCEERLAEAGGKGGLWVGYTVFGAAHLTGIARDEVV